MAEIVNLKLSETAALKLMHLTDQRGPGSEGDIIAEALGGWFGLELLTDEESAHLRASVEEALSKPGRSSPEAVRNRLLARYKGSDGEAVSS